MRACALIFPSLLIAAIGCGDGVGHPIVSGASVTQSAAGSGGAMSGAGGTAGLAAGMAGIPSEAPGLGGMPGGMPGTGGAAGRRVDFEAPWNGGPGPDRPDDTDMHPVPDGELCRPAAEWDDEANAAEQQLLEVLNYARNSGVGCDGGEGMPAPPLAMRPELRCAARLHSRDMSEGNFCGHVNLEGVGPEDRIRDIDYDFGVAGESILCDVERVWLAPSEVLTRLVETGGSDCKNLGDPRFDAVGIGWFDDLWTLDFAGP